MKNIYILLILSFIILVSSCKKIYDPMESLVLNYTFYPLGSNQRTVSGSYFSDTVGLIIYGYSYSSRNSLQSKVRFKVLSGGGEIEDTLVYPNSNGAAFTRWKSGTTGVAQKLEADIYNTDDKLIGTEMYSCFAFADNQWNSFSVIPENSINDMLGDTINHKSIMVSGCSFYQQSGQYFNWLQMNTNNICGKNIWLCKDGTYFLSANNSDFYKSLDQGQTWSQCSGLNTYFYLYVAVTPDKYLWASWAGRGLHCSRDGGQSWTVDSIGTGSEQLADIYHLSNGNWLFNSLSGNSYISADDGHSWTAFNHPANAVKLFVGPGDEIIYITSQNNFSVYKSTNLGVSYSMKYSINSGYNGYKIQVIPFKNFWYILIPGYGILKTYDFNTFTIFWNNVNVYSMFLDHNGVILTRGLNGTNNYYYKGN